MNLKIVAKKTTITDSLKGAIEHELSALNKYIDKNTVVSASVEILSNIEQKFAIHTIYDAQIVKAEAVDADLYVAITQVADKIKRQIIKINTMNKSLNYLKGKSFKEQPLDKDTDINIDNIKITKRKKFDMKPMLEAEAILQMELLGHSSFMFYNAELDTMCLLYKKKHNRFGIIEGILGE